MKKNKPGTASASAAAILNASPRKKSYGWYDDLSQSDRAIVDAVVARALKSNKRIKWYVVADSLIHSLGLNTQVRNVVNKLQQLAGAR